MKLGIIIYSNDAETVWNAFRLGVFALNEGDAVKVFLFAKGVEAENLDSKKFKVTEQIQEFVNKKGEILVCGTCLKIRNMEGSEQCPLSTMKDLHELIKESDKLLSL